MLFRSAGMERTRRAMERADLVLHLAEAPRAPLDQFSGLALESFVGAPCSLLVVNKCDLGTHTGWRAADAVQISCTTGEGMDSLMAAIEAKALGGAAKGDWSVAINARHQSCLETARDFLRAALGAFDQALSPEFIAEELRAAMDAIGDIVGRADTEELLGVIFGQFCIGK